MEYNTIDVAPGDSPPAAHQQRRDMLALCRDNFHRHGVHDTPLLDAAIKFHEQCGAVGGEWT
jgi:hypothetical protein